MEQSAEVCCDVLSIVRQLSLKDPGDGAWIWSPQLIATFSSHTNSIAFAHKNELLVSRCIQDDQDANSERTTSSRTCSTSEAITSVSWLHYFANTMAGSKYASPSDPLGSGSNNGPVVQTVLLLGTESGFLQIHNINGQPLLRQRVATSCLCRIQIRSRDMGSGSSSEWHAGDITLVFKDAVARASMADLAPVLHLCQHAGRSGASQDVPAINFQKWLVPKGVGPRSDGICLGVKPADLYTVLQGRAAAGSGKFNIITAGANPTIAALEADEHVQRGTLAAIADVATSLATGVFDLARSARSRVTSGPKALAAGLSAYVLSPLYGRPAPSQPVPTHDRLEDAQPAEPATLWRCIRDGKRCVTSLAPAPQGCLVAVTDNLGRVMVLDAVAMTVVRIWKGYRDAQVGWIELPEEEEGSMGPKQLLVVYAPKRQSVEMWLARQGTRVCSLSLDGPCRLLQCTRPIGPAGYHDEEDEGEWNYELAHTCWLLEASSGCMVDLAACLEE